MVKLILLGSSGAGKSSMLMRWADDAFSAQHHMSIGIDFKVKTVVMDGIRVRIQAWDTTGQERFQTIARAYYRGVHGVFFVFDPTDKESFISVKHWVKRFESENNVGNHVVPRLLVSTKSDLTDQKAVSREDAEALASSMNCALIETSSKLVVGVNEAFEDLTRKCLAHLSVVGYVPVSGTLLRAGGDQ